MAKKWTIAEENIKRAKLRHLYVKENKTISEIAFFLGIGESTVYDQLVRLGIPSMRYRKPKYNNKRDDIVIPRVYSKSLAEFIGILLGDGHISPTQVTVTLGKKDEYVDYVVRLMKKLFKAEPKNIVLPKGDYLIYLGSTVIVRWLLSMGLAFNKVKAQVNIPSWIFSKKDFMKGVLKGLIDTDGSVYRLKFGVQVAFCNRSRPLVRSVSKIFSELGFHPSKVSGYNIYLTRQEDLVKFFREIGFGNNKHSKRFLEFMGASHSGNCTRL